jgi:hypothetical protein
VAIVRRRPVAVMPLHYLHKIRLAWDTPPASAEP